MSEKLNFITTNINQSISSTEAETSRLNVGLNFRNGESIGDATHPMYWDSNEFVAGDKLFPIYEQTAKTTTVDSLSLNAGTLITGKPSWSPDTYADDDTQSMVIKQGSTAIANGFQSILYLGNDLWYNTKKSGSTSWNGWHRIVTAKRQTRDQETNVSAWDALFTDDNVYSMDGTEVANIGQGNYIGQLKLKAVGSDGKASSSVTITPQPINGKDPITVTLPSVSGTLATESYVDSFVEENISGLSNELKKYRIATMAGRATYVNHDDVTVTTPATASNPFQSNSKVYKCTGINGEEELVEVSVVNQRAWRSDTKSETTAMYIEIQIPSDQVTQLHTSYTVSRKSTNGSSLSVYSAGYYKNDDGLFFFDILNDADTTEYKGGIIIADGQCMARAGKSNYLGVKFHFEVEVGYKSDGEYLTRHVNAVTIETFPV